VALRTAEGLSDRDLVERAREGDRWAQEALVRRYLPDVAAIVARLLGDKLEAEDVVQDTVEATLTNLPRLRDPDAVRAWMIQIAVRKVHRRYRRRSLLRALRFGSGEPAAGLASLASEACSPEQRAELSLLDRALASLPASDRIAWVLRYVEDMQLEEVARSCACSLATAKRRIARADRHVRAHVRLDEGGE
jgi:RNA polymerase sigma-70 factor (ECF subfamily)